jgi:methionine-rich copper-binding protein CopC
MRKVFTTAGVALVLMVTMVTPALAHDVLISTDPVKGAQLTTGPAKVTLTFDQYVQTGGANEDVDQIAVTGPGGQGQWADSPVTVSNNLVSAPLRPLGPAGVYTIGYRILSADGHAVTGESTFTLTKAGTGSPASASAATAGTSGRQSDSGGVPIWVWIAGAVVLLGLGLTVALRTGRESPKS